MSKGNFKLTALSLLAAAVPLKNLNAQESINKQCCLETQDTWKLRGFKSTMPVGIGLIGADKTGHSRIFTDVEVALDFHKPKSRWRQYFGVEAGLARTMNTNPDNTIEDAFFGLSINQAYCTSPAPATAVFGPVAKGGLVISDHLAVGDRKTGAYAKLGLTFNFEMYSRKNCSFCIGAEGGGTANTITKTLAPYAAIAFYARTR